MAQYGHNWYGTAYYGKTNAFSGWYQTKEIFTDEALKNTLTVKMRATLPSATYGVFEKTSTESGAPYVIRRMAGVWTADTSLGKISSSSADAELYMAATCDHLSFRYEQRTVSAKMNIEITTTEVGKDPVVNSYVLDTQGTTVNANAVYEITNLPYGQQQIKIVMATDSPENAAFHFKGFTARTANLTIESRARVTFDPQNPMADSSYAKLATTVTKISGNDYLVTATTPNYQGRKYVQFKVYLASSDNETTPEVHYIEMVAGDSNNRTADGEWSAVFNMANIAQEAGVSFSKVNTVTWNQSSTDGPATTSLTIRSQSSTQHQAEYWNLAKKTVPYKKNVNRIRLKEGFNSGWIDTPILAPQNKFLHTTNKGWTTWNDQSFLPPDSSGVSVRYDFISTQKDNAVNPYVRINNPMNVAKRTFSGTRLNGLDTAIRITLTRPSGLGKETPVVDFITLDASLYYEQTEATKDQEFSAVDFKNTGKGVILDTSTEDYRNKFKIPSTTNDTVSYRLIDQTQRPQDVLLYFDSERNVQGLARKGVTNTLINKIWAESKASVRKHYQYGGGQVKFPLTDEIQMAPTFTPSLNTSLRYRYHLEMGWPTEYRTIQSGDTLQDISDESGYSIEDLRAANPKITYNNDGSLMEGQRLTLPNDSNNKDVRIYWKSTNREVTSKSTQNAVLERKANMESDSVVAEVSEASIYGWVDWVSEEKIYDGVVNLNDLRSEYKRTHITPDSGDSAQIEYVADNGDTYKKIADIFGVYEEDVRLLNGVMLAEDQPTMGQRILVPSRIVLPSLLPEAVVSANPYEINIVYNSVKKANGKILPASVMTAYPIEVTYRTVQREAILTRGRIQNGKDVLPDPRITKIISVRSADGMTTYNEYNETLKIGNFKLDGNFIDWSPSDVEPAANALYTVRYEAQVPDKVTIRIDTTYQEEGGVDRIWRSPEVKEFKGMCYPGKDFVAALPDFSQWMGLPDPNVEDIQYLVEDNDIWVKTWVEKRGDIWYVIGSLQDRVPKDNWFPTMKTGYYYLGKEEFYLFNEPITIEPTEREIPIAENVDFVEGKFQNAVKVQEGSQNLVRNSGFDIPSEKTNVLKLTF